MTDPRTVNYLRLELLLKEANKTLQLFFRQCWKQQKNGVEWPNDPAAGKALVPLFPTFKKKQKEILAGGDCTLWDTTMTHQVLDQVVPPKARAKGTPLYSQFEAITAIVVVRNEQAHRSQAAMDDTTFTTSFDKVAKALVLLGLPAAEAEKLRTEPLHPPAAPAPAQEVPAALALKTSGNEEHKAKNFTKAIDLYTQALIVEGQTDHMRAILYSNRSASHLEAGQLENATADAKTAKQLSPMWWRAHFRLARCYRKRGKLGKAISSLDFAAALSPGNKEVEAERSSCRHERGTEEREEAFNPHHMPNTVQEMNEQLTGAFGSDMQLGDHSASDFPPKVAAWINEFVPGQFDCSRGHQFMHGDSKANISVDYKKALAYFSKAASVKNAEGYYNLALLYTKGWGVPVDHNRAVSFLKLAAQQPPEYPPPIKMPRLGVADAEFALGLRYSEGVGVEKDLQSAIHWYERAASHGAPNAANNLGHLYLNGNGVPRDLDKAVSLFKFSAGKGDPNAMMALSKILELQGNRAMALEWLRRAANTGLLSAQIALQEKEASGTMADFEGSGPGPFPTPPLQHLLEEHLSSLFAGGGSQPSALNSKGFPFDFTQLSEAAKKGSKTAAGLVEAKRLFDSGLSLLKSQKDQEAVLALGEAVRITEIVCSLTHETRTALRTLLPPLMKEGAGVSPLDKAARYCWIIVNQGDLEAMVPFMQRCTTKYTEEPRFWDIRASVHGLRDEWQKGLIVIKEGLARHPADVELLYSLGKFSASVGDLVAESGEAYRSFLAVAPSDHLWVPHAHYALAFQQLTLTGMKPDFEELLRPGLEAERVQLPCFLPVESRDKRALEGMRNMSTSTKDSLKAEAEQAAAHTRERKRNAWLNDLRRIQFFSDFREAAAHQKQLEGSITRPWTVTPLERATAAPLNASLKSISLAEMDPRADVIYEGRILSVTVLAVPHSTGSSLATLIQDTSGECNRLFIYNKPNFNLALGDILAITNPHHRIARDLKTAIRVDDPRSVIKTGSTMKPCNACGQAEARFSCQKCGVHYCSKDCQLVDWKPYGHKLVCVAQ